VNAVEVVICDECGEPIEPPEVPVLMARADGAPPEPGKPHWRSGLVLRFHLNCAPRELVGVWRRVL
jgi:hypothetical protein